MGGWKLFKDIFTSNDIKKTSRVPDFIFSNSCGNSSILFINFINSLLNKGSKVIISSLGSLPSKKASEFSQIFYKYFTMGTHNVGKAFFLAREEMIKKYGQDDLFWCFYQMYGSSLIRINKKSGIAMNKSNRKSFIKYFSSINYNC